MSPIQSILPGIMQKILTKPIRFIPKGLGGYEANMGNGVNAKVFIGGSEGPTKIFISDGKETIKKEIRECWLRNWQVIKEIKVDH
jgi:aldehyde:ferredoxin oxidoreductase